MKVDFIHVGFHKTASSWLQTIGFPAHPDLGFVNSPKTPLGEYFVKNFAEVPEFHFDKNQFNAKLEELCNQHIDNKKLVYGISEENISGNIWNASGAEILANRLYEVFGKTKIIIVIREQASMISSAYSNYLKHGGTKSLKDLYHDQNLAGYSVFYKLAYSRFIQHYVNLFGRENVLVICYESFQKNSNDALNSIFRFTRLKEIELTEGEGRKKINLRHTIPSEIIIRILNIFTKPYRSRVIIKLLHLADKTIFSSFFRSAESVMATVPAEIIQMWQKDNVLTQEFCSDNMKDLGYKMP